MSSTRGTESALRCVGLANGEGELDLMRNHEFEFWHCFIVFFFNYGKTDIT